MAQWHCPVLALYCLGTVLSWHCTVPGTDHTTGLSCLLADEALRRGSPFHKDGEREKGSISEGSDKLKKGTGQNVAHGNMQ